MGSSNSSAISHQYRLFASFSAINDNEIWTIIKFDLSNRIQQYVWNTTTQQFDAGFGTGLSGVTQITTGKEDGSVWALDNQGGLYSWDGTNFNLFNGVIIQPFSK